MSELGQLLKKARTQRGLTLDDLQESTKIRKRYLEAIEEGNYSVLPGNFYVRAFIRSFAEAVGLDPADVLQLYRVDVPDPPVETKAEPVRRRRKKPRNTQRMNRWLSALLFISFPLLIVIVVYYFAYDGFQNRQQPPDDPLPLTDQVASEIDPEPAEDPAETLQPEPEPEPEPEPVISLLKSDGITDYYVLTGSEELTVVIEVTGDRCWMAIRQDDENGEVVEANLTMNNGDKREWVFEKGAFFHFGRANAIDVTVNGLEIKVGDSANPRKLQIELATDDASNASVSADQA